VKQTQFLGLCLKSPNDDELPPGDAWMCGIGIFHEKKLVSHVFCAAGIVGRWFPTAKR